MSGRVAGNVVAVLCMLIWATNFPVGTAIMETWHPLLLAPFRMGAAGAALVLVVLVIGQWSATLRLFRQRKLMLAGVALGLSAIAFVWGQKMTGPVVASVLVSTMPLFSALIGRLEGRERFTGRLVAALALAVTGGTIISFAEPDTRAVGSSPLGILLMLLAVSSYVWYTRLVVDEFADGSTIPAAAASTVAGVLTSTVVAGTAALLGLVPLEVDFSLPTAGMIVWLGGVAIGLTTVLWLYAGKRIGVTVAAMHHNLVPFYVIAMGALFGGSVQAAHVLGAMLVIAGAVLAQLPARPAAAAVQTT